MLGRGATARIIVDLGNEVMYAQKQDKIGFFSNVTTDCLPRVLWEEIHGFLVVKGTIVRRVTTQRPSKKQDRHIIPDSLASGKFRHALGWRGLWSNTDE